MKKGEKGYSLIEVLAAFAIISIAILPIMSMYPAIFKQNKSASEIEEASRIASTIVDYIKARGYTNLTTKNANGITDKVKYNSGTGNYIHYSLKHNTGSKTYFTKPESSDGDYKLDKDLGFSTTSGVIFLNSKGLNLGECVIAVKMSATNIEMDNGLKVISPITGISSEIVDGKVNDKFISGKVIIGWGKTIAVEKALSEEQKEVLKERAYGVDYIITPKLKK